MRFTQTFAAFLDLTAAALQDAHPGLGRCAVEERQVHAEAVVGVVLRTGVGHQFGEALPARVGELVDAPRAAQLRRPVRCGVLDDQAVGLHPAQRRVQRTVGERPEARRAERVSRLRSS